MSEQQISRYIETLASSIPESEAPIGALLATGERRRRRRASTLVTIAAGLAVALVVGVVAALAGGGPDQGVRPAGDPSATGTDGPGGAPALDGTWVVEVLVASSGRNVYRDPTGAGTVQVTFEDGVLNGTTGCNTIFGSYVRDGDDLTFPRRDLGTTLVGCPDEPPLVDRLLDVRRLSKGDGARVQLNAENGMIVAVLVRPEDSGRPAGELSPSGPGDLCQTPVVVFRVAQPPEADRAESPEAAVEPWLQSPVRVQEVASAEGGDRYVVVGAETTTPVAVLRVQRTTSGWVIEQTAVCLVAAPDSGGCGEAVDGPGDIRWIVQRDGLPRPGVGGIWGQGRIPVCARFDVVGQRGLAPRGSVAPVTLYRSPEMPTDEELTVSIVESEVRRVRR